MRRANLQQLRKLIERDIEPVKLSDMVIGQTLTQQMEMETQLKVPDMLDDTTGGPEELASSTLRKHQSQDVNPLTTAVHTPGQRKPPSYHGEYIVESSERCELKTIQAINQALLAVKEEMGEKRRRG